MSFGVRVIISSKKDDRCFFHRTLFLIFSQFLQRFKAVHFRHFYIEQYQVGSAVLRYIIKKSFSRTQSRNTHIVPAEYVSGYLQV